MIYMTITVCFLHQEKNDKPSASILLSLGQAGAISTQSKQYTSDFHFTQYNLSTDIEPGVFFSIDTISNAVSIEDVIGDRVWFARVI